jgi:acyl-CoA synthetase (NDP forming)
VAALGRLLRPRSIAVVGGDPAARVVDQCRRLGFDGEIWPVHPRRTEMHGAPCVPSIADLPSPPDAAFVAVNRRLTVAALADLAAMGAGGAVCYASGFAESGDAALQDEFVAAAGSMPALGPNCYGYVNAMDGVAMWPDEHGCGRTDGGAGIVSQSGNVGLNLTLQRRGLRIASLVTVGNQAVCGVEDVLESFLDDDRVRTVGLFLEALRDPRRFAALSERAHRQGVPIVALQTGRSEAGAAIAASHTASLAGNREAYAALFERCGVATVDTPAELVETLKLLAAGGPLRGPRMASLSCSGGEASLVADLSERTTLRFESFPADQRARIESTLDELVSVANPFDYHTFMWGDRPRMSATFAEVMDGPIDATMLVLDAPPAEGQDPSTWIAAAEALADAADRRGSRAVVVATLPECVPDALRDAVEPRGIPVLQGLGEAMTALDRGAWLGASSALPPPASVSAPGRSVVLDEHAAKTLLGARGVAVPVGVRTDRAGAAAAAASIGYPVTLKALGLAHKSEHGAVAVGIADEPELVRAIARMPDSPDGYLVEQTVAGPAAEVLVSVRRAAPVGWVLTVGTGGVTTELWRDVRCLLAPASAAGIEGALRTLRTWPLLDGFRGRPRTDIGALVALVLALQDAVVGSAIVEAELNPVLVGTSGATAVDALVTVEEDAP